MNPFEKQQREDLCDLENLQVWSDIAEECGNRPLALGLKYAAYNVVIPRVAVSMFTVVYKLKIMSSHQAPWHKKYETVTIDEVEYEPVIPGTYISSVFPPYYNRSLGDLISLELLYESLEYVLMNTCGLTDVAPKDVHLRHFVLDDDDPSRPTMLKSIS